MKINDTLLAVFDKIKTEVEASYSSLPVFLLMVLHPNNPLPLEKPDWCFISH